MVAYRKFKDLIMLHNIYLFASSLTTKHKRMKTLRLLSISLFFVFALSLVSCNSNKKKQGETAKTEVTSDTKDCTHDCDGCKEKCHEDEDVAINKDEKCAEACKDSCNHTCKKDSTCTKKDEKCKKECKKKCDKETKKSDSKKETM